MSRDLKQDHKIITKDVKTFPMHLLMMGKRLEPRVQFEIRKWASS